MFGVINKQMNKTAKNWILQAESDFETAKYNDKGNKLDIAAYLCHQTAEKSLKAVYLEKTNKLWKTHDLVKLCMLVNAPKDIIKVCNDLNPIYAEDKYPDFSDIIPAKKFKREDIKDFLTKAGEVLKWTHAQLK